MDKAIRAQMQEASENGKDVCLHRGYSSMVVCIDVEQTDICMYEKSLINILKWASLRQ